MKLDVENLPPDLRGEDINVQYLDMTYGVAEQISRNCDGSLWVLFDCLAQKRIQRHTMARNAVFMPLGIRCPVAYTGIGAHTKA